MNDRGGGARGQATVELALVLPVVLAMLLMVVQVGLVVRDQILVINAAREGARTAAIDPSAAAVRRSVVDSGALDPSRVLVSVEAGSTTVTVTVTYRAPTSVPLIGPLVGDVTMRESTTMRRETG